MAAIGLKTQIWNNNLRSLILLASYPFLVAIIIWAISFLAGWALSNSGSSEYAINYGFSFSKNFILQYWPVIFSAVLIWFIIAWFFQTRMIRALSHAHPVSREEEPELYNLLENLCVARGMKMPKLEIIETRARNAFASGINTNSYSITVTRGLLQSLQRDEVEAVLGHELTHIRHGDVRLLIISVIFTGMIGFFAQMAWSSIRFGLYARAGGRKRDARIMLFIMAIVIILWLGYIATMFTRFALSRRREYMADAGSIELTKNPDAMMRALLRLSGKDRIPEATDDIALMCIENSRKFFGVFSTHPPLEDRIKAISETTDTPIPELKPGFRADDETRFKNPQDRQFPWLSAARKDKKKTRASPWK